MAITRPKVSAAATAATLAWVLRAHACKSHALRVTACMRRSQRCGTSDCPRDLRLAICIMQTESMGRTDRGDVGTNTELHSEALSLGSTGPRDIDEVTSQTDKWSILNDEVRLLAGCKLLSAGTLA